MSNWKDLQKSMRALKGKVEAPAKTVIKSSKKKVKTESKLEKYAIKPSTASVVNGDDKMATFIDNKAKTLAGTLIKDDHKLFTLGPESLDYPANKRKAGNFVALDCEFVGTGFNGSVSTLARVSIVNYYGYELLDVFVKPEAFVTDWRTKYSGITPELVRNGISFIEAQRQVEEILNGRVLIGHGLINDMRVLKVPHPRTQKIDTQNLQRYRTSTEIRKNPGLKRVSAMFLGFDIQQGAHSSVEDARATMLIFRRFKDEYLKEQHVSVKTK